MKGPPHLSKHKKPPQGTHSIHGEGRERRIEHGANQLIGGVFAFNQIKEDEDWDAVARTAPDPEAWKRLVEKYGKETVAEAHRFWNRNGRPT